MDSFIAEMIEADARRLNSPVLFLLAALAALDAAALVEGFPRYLWGMHAAALVDEAGLNGYEAFRRLGFHQVGDQWTDGTPEPQLFELRQFIAGEIARLEWRK